MKSNTQLLAIAISQLGNNGSKYRKYAGYGGSWCNMFVYWLFNANDCGSLFPMKTAQQKTYCPTSIKWCNANLAMIPAYLVMPCDIIYFDWDKNGKPNHIGIVEKRESTGVIHTIEGNTSGGIVARKKRDVKYVQGVYRPLFFPTGLKKEHIDEDGAFEYKSVYNLQCALKISSDGIIGKGTVSALQKRAGLTGKQIDGAWGATTSKAVQRLVGLTGKAVDGQFGKQSTIALQKWINKQNGFTTTATTKPTTSTTKYTGEFPNWVLLSGNIINAVAKDLAYPLGTSTAKYTYPKGKAKASFTSAINKAFPKRSSWSKQCQAGASCDVGASTVIRFSGADASIPRGLEQQIPYMAKNKRFKDMGIKKSASFRAGDIGIYSNKGKGAHIWIVVDNGIVCEANHTSKYFLHLKKKSINWTTGRKVWKCYRIVVPIREYIKKGDRGTEVTKMQNFLNWAGFNCGKADGVFGDNTLKAVKAFQSKVGVTADGEFGNASLTKAKGYTK